MLVMGILFCALKLFPLIFIVICTVLDCNLFKLYIDNLNAAGIAIVNFV